MTRMKRALDDPLVSVIIPVYNTAEFLDECLGSLMHQTYQKLEIICVDDGSTDASWDILSAYAGKDTRIICQHQDNQGQSVARNKGLAAASGEYVCFLDSDDYLDRSTIQRCVDVVMRTGAEIVLFNMEMFFPDGLHFKCFAGSLFPGASAALSSEKDEVCVNFTNAATGFYCREVLLRNALQFRPGMIYEDWVFMVDLMTAEDLKIFWIEDSLYWYRRNFSKSTTSNVSEACLDIFQAYWLSKRRLTLASRKSQLYINDAKILRESTGFILFPLRRCRDRHIIARYIEETLRILAPLPPTYFFFLCNYLGPVEKKAAEILYKNTGRSKQESQLVSLYRCLNRACFCVRLMRKGTEYLRRILKKIVSLIRGRRPGRHRG